MHHVTNDYVLGVVPAPAPAPIAERKSAAKTAAKAPAKPAAPAPAVVDLRAHAPAPGDQGSIADCTAWTVGYSIMGYWANVEKTDGAPFAPLYLYLKSLRGSQTAPNGGTSGWDALTVASTTGVDTQADYVQGTQNWATPPTAAQDTNASHYLVSDWSHLFEGSHQGSNAQRLIEKSLNAGQPVALGLEVFRNFESLGPNQVYQGPSGSDLGGHMVAVYGYSSQGVIVRNSWSTYWGTNGDAILSWSYVDSYAIDAYAVAGINVTDVAPPAVTAITEASASANGGDTITVNGSGFTGAKAVRIDKATVPVSVASDSQLTFVAPRHAPGVVDVVVVASNGKTVSATTSADQLTYAAPPAPVVSSLDTTSGPTYGSTTVTVSGTGLAQATKVLVDGLGVKAHALTDSSFTIAMPTHAAGTVDIQVVAPFTSSDLTAADQFIYVTPPAPVVTSIAPASGLSTHSTTVTLTGTDVSHTSAVLVGGHPVKPTASTDTTVTVVLPPHVAGALDLQVVTDGGASPVVATDQFTYTQAAAPSVTHLSQASARTRIRATTVQISGSSFTGVTSVTLGSTPVAFTFVSDGVIRVTLPAHAAGSFDLRVTTSAGTSAATPADVFRYRR